MGYLNSLLISGILCLVIYISSSTALVRRFNYDAVLYEEFSVDSKYVQYSRTKKESWKNLSTLATANKMQFHAMVCTRGEGSWLAYPKEKYEIGDGLFYTLIMGEACVSTDSIKSLQPLGDIQLPLDAGVIVFPKEHFQSDQKVVASGSYSGDIGSILYAGGNPWTVTAGSDSVCIMPTYVDHGDTLCLLPTLDSSLRLKGPQKTVKEGCTGTKVRMVSAQMCYNSGVHRIFPNTDFSFANMNGVCTGGKAGNDTQNKFNLMMEIWKGRISHGIEEIENIKIPYEATYKQRVLWQLINVFQVGCPLVPPPYIALLRNVFLMHLRTAWTKQPELIGVEDDYWRHAYMFLTSCGDTIAENPDLHDQGGHCVPMELDDELSPDAGAYQELLSGENYDSVIEQVWLMFNLVTPYCNWINGFKTNDWSEIVSLLRRHFLEPLGKQWMQPGSWQRIYSSMFHGFNIRHQHLKILTCVQNALAKTPHFDPIGRTRYFLQAERDSMQAASGQKPVTDNSIDGGGASGGSGPEADAAGTEGKKKPKGGKPETDEPKKEDEEPAAKEEGGGGGDEEKPSGRGIHKKGKSIKITPGKKPNTQR